MSMFFNKNLFDELGFDYPYELVKDGEWTFDEFAYLAKKGGKDLVGKLKSLLENKVKDVKFSSVLTESASRLSGDDYDPSPYMQRIMKALDKNAQTFKRILELNPAHPLIEALTKLVEKSPDNPKLGEFAEMLYDQALLAEGSPIADPALFAKRAAALMTLGVEKEI